jgi:hypothetical protein
LVVLVDVYQTMGPTPSLPNLSACRLPRDPSVMMKPE